MSYGTDKKSSHTHTDTHRDAGDDNIRRPILASGKNEINVLIMYSFGIVTWISFVYIYNCVHTHFPDKRSPFCPARIRQHNCQWRHHMVPSSCRSFYNLDPSDCAGSLLGKRSFWIHDISKEIHDEIFKYQIHDMETFSVLLSVVRGIEGHWFPSQAASNKDLWYSLWFYHKKAAGKSVKLPVIWHSPTHMWRHSNG